MKKNSKKTANIATIESPIVNPVTVEAPPAEVITETASIAETKPMTEEEIIEAAKAKLKIEAKKAKYALKMEKYRKNAAKRKEGQRISLKRLSINNTIPDGDKKKHPDVAPMKMLYINELNRRRKEAKDKLKAESEDVILAHSYDKEERKAAGLKTRKQKIDEIKLKSGKTVAERLTMLGDRRANRMNRRLEQAKKVTEAGKENLAQFIKSQEKRNEKRGYVRKSTFHTAAQKEAIKAQVATRKAAKATKPLQFKVEGETTNEYMAICAFVRPNGTKLLQKKYWHASNKDGADPKAVLKAKVQKIFDSLESKNGTRSIVFESINVYPNFGKDMGECVTNMLASKKHIATKLNATATAMSAAA